MHDTTDDEPEDAMNKPVGAIGATATGSLAMSSLDPELGARRRALLADLVRSGWPGEQRGPVRGRGRYGRRAYLRPSPSDPRSDAELRDRIQSALDQMVSHPRALHVAVEKGVVHLGGRLLSKEREGVLEQVQRMPGVHKLVNATTAHDDPQELAGGERLIPLPAASR